MNQNLFSDLEGRGLHSCKEFMIGSSVPSAAGRFEKVQLIIEINHRHQELPYFATRRSPNKSEQNIV